MEGSTGKCFASKGGHLGRRHWVLLQHDCPGLSPPSPAILTLTCGNTRTLHSCDDGKAKAPANWNFNPVAGKVDVLPGQGVCLGREGSQLRTAR